MHVDGRQDVCIFTSSAKVVQTHVIHALHPYPWGFADAQVKDLKETSEGSPPPLVFFVSSAYVLLYCT